MTALTPRQHRVLAYIRGCGDLPPTLREIKDACGISSTSVVSDTLDALEATGYITRETGKARSIRLVGADPRDGEIARLRRRVRELEVELQDRDWDIIKRISEAIK